MLGRAQFGELSLYGLEAVGFQRSCRCVLQLLFVHAQGAIRATAAAVNSPRRSSSSSSSSSSGSGSGSGSGT